MNQPYKPRLDSVAHRAMAHINGLPPKTEISTGELGLAINVDTNRLLHSLETLAAYGMLSRRCRAAHPKSPWFWRIPSAEPPKAVEPEEPAAEIPAPEATELGTIPAPAPKWHSVARPEFKLWENGVLEMQRTNGDILLLTPDEATALTGWLVRGLRVHIDPALL